MSKFELNFKKTNFDLLNALRMAESSQLAYKPEGEVRKYLNTEWGMSKVDIFDKDETQAFLCSNNDVAILAFRGTDSSEDWQKDFNAVLVDSKTGYIHKGFKQALDNVWKEIDKALVEHIREDQALWVTGHSLGGALATLAVDRFTDSKVPIGGMYTFGQPMVGDEKFADNYNRKIKNVASVETECFFDCAGVLHRNHIWYHKLLSSSDNAEVLSRPELDKLKAQYPNGIQDHGLDYYIKYINKTLLAEKPSEPGRRTFKDYANNLFKKGTP
jgi:hypothetical protein